MHSIGIIGDGCIYQQIERKMREHYQVLPLTDESSERQLAACEIVLACSDTWSPGLMKVLNRRCRQADVALLPVFTQFDEGLIGPCTLPRKQGCTTCADLRRLGATSAEHDRELMRQMIFGERVPAVAQPWLSSFALETLAVLAGEEVAAYLDGGRQVRTEGAMLIVSLTTLECSRHTFLPFPVCPVCAEAVRDSAELAVIDVQARPKADPYTYRVSQPAATGEQILARYVDERMGLVSSLVVENTNLLPLASAHLSSEAEATAGTGCTLYPARSKAVAVLEVIERYAGLRSRGKRAAVRASYRQLVRDGQPVLDPVTLGLHSAEQYEQHERYRQQGAGRHLVPYHPDLIYRWVWGYSWQRQAPLLVPEHCAYYGVPAGEENPLFVFDISNGCALGNALEEAVFHGILEVVERDAFLLTWYARLQVPRLDLCSVTDSSIRALVEHLEYHTGYTIYAYNITLDHAVPCLCLLGVDEQKRAEMPRAFVAAGSHPHPEQALLKALREFAMFLAFPRRLDEQSRAQALELLADASLVRKMEQHPLVYYLPEAFERLHFLYHTPRQQTFQEAFADFYRQPPERLDLRDDLDWLTACYLERGTDVVVVDQTAPEHRPCDLHCVKVLMPGMLPMTFGQHNRRVVGFERLRQLPFTLGYRDRPLEMAEINPHPHPFF